jgi:hypothetical protein
LAKPWQNVGKIYAKSLWYFSAKLLADSRKRLCEYRKEIEIVLFEKEVSGWFVNERTGRFWTPQKRFFPAKKKLNWKPVLWGKGMQHSAFHTYTVRPRAAAHTLVSKICFKSKNFHIIRKQWKTCFRK